MVFPPGQHCPMTQPAARALLGKWDVCSSGAGGQGPSPALSCCSGCPPPDHVLRHRLYLRPPESFESLTLCTWVLEHAHGELVPVGLQWVFWSNSVLPWMKCCSLPGSGSYCHPVMNGASVRCNTLFVLEVSVRLKGILHKPNQGVCAYVTRLVRVCETPSNSHCPEWEQSSFEDLTHKLSASSPLVL